MTTKFAQLDKSVRPNPSCGKSVFYSKGMTSCKLLEYCPDKFDFGFRKFCGNKDEQKKQKEKED